MAWNEPGGNPSGNRDPWGQRPNSGSNQNPPDLDEALRQLKQKLSNLFGGGQGGSGGNGGARRPGGKSGDGWTSLVSLVAGVLVVLWLGTGVYSNDAAERGVISRFGAFNRIVGDGAGIHLPWPIETMEVVNISSIDSFSDQTRMLTSDENLVDIDMEVQFRRADPVAFVFNVRDPESTLREVSESAIREIIGRSKLDSVLESGRQVIATNTKELIQKTLDAYKAGIEITSVNLKDVKVPEQVASAQQDAIKAREDKERYSLEAQAYANDILPKAKGTAAAKIQDAEAYKAQKVALANGESQRFLKLLPEYQRAPRVTRDRLYLETLEAIYASSKKVFIDAKGNGNMIYLPLDKLMENARANAAGEAGNASRQITVDSASASDGRTREAR
jgi:modulator of FtsH protease HflK